MATTVKISSPHAPTYPISSAFSGSIANYNSLRNNGRGTVRQTASVPSPSLTNSPPSSQILAPKSVPVMSLSAATNPSFFSWEGQKTAIARTIAVLNPFDTDRLNWVNPFTGSNTNAPGVKTVVRVAEAAGVVYGAALLLPSSTAAAMAVSTTTAGTIGANSLRNNLIAAGIGAGAATMLLPRNTEQIVTPTQDQKLDVLPEQKTEQAQRIDPDQTGAYISLSGQGNSLRYSQSQDVYSTYNAYAAPSQSIPIDQTAGQTTSPSLSASSDWLLPALIVGVALVVSR